MSTFESIRKDNQQRFSITVKQAAHGVGKHEKTILDWCQRGKIPATKLGRDWRIEQSWYESHRLAN